MRIHFLSLIFGFCVSVRALSAISGSPCYSTCKGDNTTSTSDIVCTDTDFSTSSKGQLFQKCMTCLHSSAYINDAKSDATLFLFYLSTVQQVCLATGSSIPKVSCSSKCATIENSFNGQNGVSFFQTPYAYCSANDNGYEGAAEGCAECLQNQSGSVILGNFVEAGYSACQSQTNVTAGKAIPLSGDLFNTTIGTGTSGGSSISRSSITSMQVMTVTLSSAATATDSSNTGSSTGTTAAAVTTGVSATPSSGQNGAAKTGATDFPGIGSTASNGAGGNTNGLSHGAAAGIGIVVGAAGIAGIIALALFARKRQQNAWQKMDDSHYPFGGSQPRGMPIKSAASITPPAAVLAKPSKPFETGHSRASTRTSGGFHATYPEKSGEFTALPQRTRWQQV